MSRWSQQDGLLGGVDALAFGTLVFITGTLLVLNSWSVLDTRMAVSAAAREAVRTVVEAPGADLSRGPAPGGGSHLDGLEARAIEIATITMEQHGRTVNPGDLVVTFAPLPAEFRCAEVVAQVSFRAPAIGLPIVGIFRGGIDVTVEHRQRIDPFRAGIGGEVACA